MEDEVAICATLCCCMNADKEFQNFQVEKLNGASVIKPSLTFLNAIKNSGKKIDQLINKCVCLHTELLKVQMCVVREQESVWRN
jgi:hypothetical protein